MPKPQIRGKTSLKHVFETLKSYHSGDLTKNETVNVLKDVDPLSLLKAEDKMLKRGMSKAELKDISDVYYKTFVGRSRDIMQQLDKDHPIRLLMLEHIVVNNLLNEMEKISDIISEGKGQVNRSTFRSVLENLEEVGKHHLREENSIFTRLETAGFSNRVEVMSKEHDEFIAHEIRLADLADNFSRDRYKIKGEIDNLVPLLRFHAFTEDVLLYPVALKTVDDWEAVKEEMEIIGFSSFTRIGDFKPVVKKKKDKLAAALEELSEKDPIYSGYLLDRGEDEEDEN